MNKHKFIALSSVLMHYIWHTDGYTFQKVQLSSCAHYVAVVLIMLQHSCFKYALSKRP